MQNFNRLLMWCISSIGGGRLCVLHVDSAANLCIVQILLQICQATSLIKSDASLSFKVDFNPNQGGP
jgi:hypothetical protein